MKAVKSLEKAVPEATKNWILEINTKLRVYEESIGHKLKDAKDNIQKNA